MHIVSRAERESWEHDMLSTDSAFSDETEGRANSGEPDDLRTEYQRDRDKIVHSKAFRRLSHKTQVFLVADGDHFRTRLTHTLEVAQIARTIARSLALNEDLTEAISLGHDLGHTPFGHTGEDALCACIGRLNAQDDEVQKRPPFRHNEQSLRVVELIENSGKGLNLTAEVRDGILCHTGSVPADTLEGRIVALSDRIAYVNHDIDDAIRAGMLQEQDLPDATRTVLGRNHSMRIQTMVMDCVAHSEAMGDIAMSPAVFEAMMDLRAFLFTNVYHSEDVERESEKARHVVSQLFDYYRAHLDEVPPEYRTISNGDDVRAVLDYVASMSDRFALNDFEDKFMPRPFRSPAKSR